MSRSKRFFDEYKWLFLWTSVLCLVLAGMSFVMKKPLIFSNDQLYQYDIFYREYYRLLRDLFDGKDLPMYSWNTYLGTDFFSSMTYYCTGDLFFIICTFFSTSIQDAGTILSAEIYICLFLSSFLFYAYLKKRGLKNRRTMTAVSLIYAFGGWGLSYLGVYMFHRFYALLPLLFIGVEHYYSHRKSYIVSIAVFLLFTQNFYLMYPSTVFLFLYCLIKEASLKHERKEFFRDLLHLLGAYISGALLSGVILAPAILTTLSSSRVGRSASGIFWQLKTYAGLLLSPISSGFPTFTTYPNIFYIDGGSHDYWFILFTGLLCFLASLQYCLKKENRPYLCGLCVLLLCLFLKPLSSLMHGFSEASLRWMILLEFYVLFTGAEGLEKEEELSVKIFFIYIGICILSYIGLLLNYSFNEYRAQLIYIPVTILMAVLEYLLYRRNRKAGILLSVSWIMVSSFFYMGCRYSLYYPYEERIDRSTVAYFEETNEDPLFRYYIDEKDIGPASDLNQNVLMDYGLSSSRTYNSMYDTSTDVFQSLNGIHDHRIAISDPYSLTMLGTKYWIVYEEKDLPKEFTFRYVQNFSDLKAYENTEWKGFGYTAEKVLPIEAFTGTSSFMDTVYLDEGYEEGLGGEYVRFSPGYQGNNYLEGNITLSKRNVLMLPIPANKGWKVYVDGVRTDITEVNGGFIGLILEEGSHEITMNFVSPGIKPGLVMSAGGGLLFLILLLLERGRENS